MMDTEKSRSPKKMKRLQQGRPASSRTLTFWTEKRCYHWLAWILPILGALALIADLIGIPWLVSENAWESIVFGVVSLFVILLGVRLWKWHRVTLDCLKLEKTYRGVLYLPGQCKVILEEPDFANYDCWEFSDAVTAEKRANEIAAFLNLPLETLRNMDVIRFRGWNPSDWCVIDTKPFFGELAVFCEQGKAAGYSVEVGELLNQIRKTTSFRALADAIVELDAKLPKDTLMQERKSLLASTHQTAVRINAYFQFLQECGGESGTEEALLAGKLRKLWAVGSLRLSEDEITADMRLGELVPRWFPPEDLDPVIHEKNILEWKMGLGKYVDAFDSVNPRPDWTIRELVRKTYDARMSRKTKNIALSATSEKFPPEAKP